MNTPALELVDRGGGCGGPEGGTCVVHAGSSEGHRLANAQVDERKISAHLPAQKLAGLNIPIATIVRVTVA